MQVVALMSYEAILVSLHSALHIFHFCLDVMAPAREKGAERRIRKTEHRKHRSERLQIKWRNSRPFLIEACTLRGLYMW